MCVSVSYGSVTLGNTIFLINMIDKCVGSVGMSIYYDVLFTIFDSVELFVRS